MARAMDPNSAGSQFFIMHETSPHLDGQYASFGKVVEGLDIVDKIAGVRTDWGDRPLKEQKIKKMTVDTFGEEYPEPAKRKRKIIYDNRTRSNHCGTDIPGNSLR